MLSLMSVVLYAVIREKGKDVPCMDCFHVLESYCRLRYLYKKPNVLTPPKKTLKT